MRLVEILLQQQKADSGEIKKVGCGIDLMCEETDIRGLYV